MLPGYLAKVLQDDCQVRLNESLVLGFSGGPDSLVLLTLMYELGANVLVAHLDHGLRPESGEESRGAKATAASFGYPFLSERVDVSAHSRKHSLSIEEAARELRYQFLFRVAEENGARAVAVAHNANDQVETVMMHLLRGAGTRGLRGMQFRLLPNPWSQTISLVRPLLGIWRQEILDFCSKRNLNPVHDRSNLDTTYFRNRLRHELIPELEKFSSGFKERLHQTANILGAEAAVVETLAKESWRNCLGERGPDFLCLDRAALLSEPVALQRTILRRAAEELRPDLRNLGFDAIENARGLASRTVSPPQDWVAGLCLLTEGHHMWVADWNADLPVSWPQAPSDAINLEVPSEIQIDGGWRLSVRKGEQGNYVAKENTDSFQAWFDRDRLGEEIVLRRRHPGDRFQPLGLEGGSQKLADFMINVKMPRRARAAWPLLCKDGEVVWVPGYRLAHPYRLRNDSHAALHVRLQHEGS